MKSIPLWSGHAVVSILGSHTWAGQRAHNTQCLQTLRLLTISFIKFVLLRKLLIVNFFCLKYACHTQCEETMKFLQILHLSVCPFILAKRYCMCMHAICLFEVMTLMEMLLSKWFHFWPKSHPNIPNRSVTVNWIIHNSHMCEHHLLIIYLL